MLPACLPWVTTTRKPAGRGWDNSTDAAAHRPSVVRYLFLPRLALLASTRVATAWHRLSPHTPMMVQCCCLKVTTDYLCQQSLGCLRVMMASVSAVALDGYRLLQPAKAKHRIHRIRSHLILQLMRHKLIYLSSPHRCILLLQRVINLALSCQKTLLPFNHTTLTYTFHSPRAQQVFGT